jgi:hypothetical protein
VCPRRKQRVRKSAFLGERLCSASRTARCCAARCAGARAGRERTRRERAGSVAVDIDPGLCRMKSSCCCLSFRERNILILKEHQRLDSSLILCTMGIVSMYASRLGRSSRLLELSATSSGRRSSQQLIPRTQKPLVRTCTLYS